MILLNSIVVLDIVGDHKLVFGTPTSYTHYYLVIPKAYLLLRNQTSDTLIQ